ncbi:MAG TPA: zinc ribbon domain-containing protein [Thermoplasmata archaeon]|nr:zinc ribbon domain-containing protein [Thermoplasmata archaeon]
MGIKTFAKTRIGQVVLIAVATGTMVGALLFLGPFIAIPTLLLFGLALPIYAGEKRPKRLAVWGVIILLVGGTAAAMIETQLFRSATPPLDSATSGPYGNGNAVLQHATVTPYLGAGGTSFAFKATLVPANLAYNTSAVAWVDLVVTTCPDATTPSSPYCNAGYPFLLLNHTFTTPTRNTSLVEFNVTLHLTTIWWWQLAAFAKNTTTVGGPPIWIYLNSQTLYFDATGPVVGDFVSTLGVVAISVSQDVALYEALPFYFVLLIYALFKARERRRREASAQGGSGATPPSGPEPPPADDARPAAANPRPSPPTGGKELACPKCQAVVYPGEKQCWKCGADLTTSSTPLPSAPPSG